MLCNGLLNTIQLRLCSVFGPINKEIKLQSKNNSNMWVIYTPGIVLSVINYHWILVQVNSCEIVKHVVIMIKPYLCFMLSS